MAAKPVRYDEEMRDFRAWARWVNRSDAGTIMKACGLTLYGSIPNWSMSIPDRTPDDPDPPIQEIDPAPAPSVGPQVQAFMEDLAVRRPPIHRALVARHLRRVGGEHQAYISESQIAIKLYGKDRHRSHSQLIKDCDKGYADYILYGTDRRQAA